MAPSLARKNIWPSQSVCGPATPALHHLLFATPERVELQKFCLKNNEIRGNSQHRAGTLSLITTLQSAHTVSRVFSKTNKNLTGKQCSFDKSVSSQTTH